MKSLLVAALLIAGCASVPSSPYSAARGSTVKVETATGLGTGVVLNDKCVLTAAHVIDQPVQTITTDSGKAFVTHTLTAENVIDVAVVCADTPLDAKPVTIRSTDLTQYEAIFTIGYPLGLSKIMSSGFYDSGEQMTLNVAPGNSGGGIFDAQSRYVGFVDTLSLYQIDANRVPVYHLSQMVTTTTITRFLSAHGVAYLSD